jgi:hypothetical protein
MYCPIAMMDNEPNYVRDPPAIAQGRSNCSCVSVVLADCCYHLWRDVLDGFALEPPILPEHGSVAVAN